jgi:hypothetical protein
MPLCTRTEFARALGTDPRSVGRRLTKIVEHLVAGEKLIPLYDYPTAGVSAAIAVNSGSLKTATPKL